MSEILPTEFYWIVCDRLTSGFRALYPWDNREEAESFASTDDDYVVVPGIVQGCICISNPRSK